MAYEDFKDLTRRKAVDNVLRDNAFNITKGPKYDGYQRGLASMVFKFFDKKASGSGIENENISNKQLAHKPIMRNLRKESRLTFYRQYLRCRSRRYAINK